MAALSDSLLPLLPSPPGSVLLAGAEPGPLGQELAAAGHTVLTGEPETSIDAVVLLALPRDGRRLREALGGAHRRLRDKGRLLIPVPGAETRDLVVALSETGFVLLKPERGATAAVYLARKETCFVREFQDGDEEQILPMFRR
ncbi:MAG TPA: cyclin family protein, partial [Thermoanaerobaculia bacterium]|nr:cyclin family protein [Thermoanaerobaculia bacterium]